MKRVALLLAAVVLSSTVAACSGSPTPSPNESGDVLFQYSTLQTLTAGVYDGEMTAGELKGRGGFGLGTFNALDGEMVMLDGAVYQVRSDGVARTVPDSAKAPFAVVTEFAPDQTIDVATPLDCAGLQSYVDGRLPSSNVPYAVKISGTFQAVKTRSVPAQRKPYRPLAEVVKTQPTFDLRDVTGVMVGFRLPGYMAGVNAAGYHLHFLTADRTAGGHVLGCQVRTIKAELDLTPEWRMVLPADPAFYQVDLSSGSPQPSTKTE